MRRAERWRLEVGARIWQHLANRFTPLPRRKKPPAVTPVTCLSEPEVIGLYARLAQRGVIVG
ncbi:MAG: hypothetical protein K8U57_02330 [Planctomycetes bacterium]|nr:hypothetical protein [Planctomycetota bacterium]